jgi:hypothetical protein
MNNLNLTFGFIDKARYGLAALAACCARTRPASAAQFLILFHVPPLPSRTRHHHHHLLARASWRSAACACSSPRRPERARPWSPAVGYWRAIKSLNLSCAFATTRSPSFRHLQGGSDRQRLLARPRPCAAARTPRNVPPFSPPQCQHMSAGGRAVAGAAGGRHADARHSQCHICPCARRQPRLSRARGRGGCLCARRAGGPQQPRIRLAEAARKRGGPSHCPLPARLASQGAARA